MSSIASPRKRHRIPRSVSEQDTLNAGSAELHNGIRNLMNVRGARGIFDDHDVSNLFDAINRTQRAIDTVVQRSSQDSNESSDKNKNSRSKKSPMTTCLTKTNRESSQASSSSCLPVRISSGAVVSNRSNQSKTDTTQSSVPSTLQVRAAIIQSIDKAKEALTHLSPETVAVAQKKIAAKLDDALTAISKAGSSMSKEAKRQVGHHINQAQLTTVTMDPHSLDQSKEITKRHLDQAMATMVEKRQTPSKIPSPRRNIAREIVRYVGENPIEDDGIGSKRALEKQALTGREARLQVARAVAAAKRTFAQSSPEKTAILKNEIDDNLREAVVALGYVGDALDPEAKQEVKYNILQARLLAASINPTNYYKAKITVVDLLDKTLELVKETATPAVGKRKTALELQAKANIVKDINATKEAILTMTADNVESVKSEIEVTLKDAIKATAELGNIMEEKNKKDVKFHLMQAELLACTFCGSNLNDKKVKLDDLLEKALQIVLLGKQEEVDVSESDGKPHEVDNKSEAEAKAIMIRQIDNVRKQIAEINDKNLNSLKKNIEAGLEEAIYASKLAALTKQAKKDVKYELMKAALLASAFSQCNIETVKPKLLDHLEQSMGIIFSAAHKQELSLPQQILKDTEQHPLDESSIEDPPKKAKSVEASKPKSDMVSGQHATAAIVRCMEHIKSILATSKPNEAHVAREEIFNNVKEADNALASVGVALPSDAKVNICRQLQKMEAVSVAMSRENFKQAQDKLLLFLEEIMATIFPATHTRSPKNLARKVIEYPDFEDKPAKAEQKTLSPLPVQSASSDSQKRIEDAINAIRADCPDSELLIFVSPVKQENQKGPCNLQVSAINRRTGKILGHFQMPESKYKSMADAKAFANYFTVRITRELKHFEDELEQLLAYLNKIPDGTVAPSSVPATIQTVETPAAIRRSILICPKYAKDDNGDDDEDEMPLEKEPTILELFEELKTDTTEKSLELFFNLAERHSFVIFARPDFTDERSTYVCDVFTSAHEFMGTTKLRGEDILVQLQRHPAVIPNFEIIVDVVDIMLPEKMKNALVTIFDKMGLISLYDRLGTFVFDIYKKWGLRVRES